MSEPVGSTTAVRSSTPQGGPTVLRIMLGAQLRRLRESRGVTADAAGYAIRASQSKISRMELGRVGFKERDIADLLDLYGVVDGEERKELLALARESNTPGWWHKYSDVVPSWFEIFLALEETASVIRGYETQFVPGLLQTHEYAHAVMALGHHNASESEIERRVSLRMRRQRLLSRPDSPKVSFVLDEAVLRRPLGGRRVMRVQLEHLIDISQSPNITLQVVPFHATHATPAGPFTVLGFADPALPDVVYLEQLTSALYLDRDADVDAYARVLDQMIATAEPAADTRRILAAVIAKLDG